MIVVEHSRSCWKDVPGFEGKYRLCTNGNIRMMWWEQNGQRVPLNASWYPDGFSERPPKLTPIAGDRSHYVVSMSLWGKSYTRSLASVLLETFVGPKPSPKHLACFLSGDPLDVRLENLKWLTKEELARLSRKRGTLKQRPFKKIKGFRYYQCAYCKRWKKKREFYAHKSPCGINSECKACANKHRHERRRRKKLHAADV